MIKLKVLIDGVGWVKHRVSLQYMDIEDDPSPPEQCPGCGLDMNLNHRCIHI